jgi:rsbT co-antagonist protein RsbR
MKQENFTPSSRSRLPEILIREQSSLLADWIESLSASAGGRTGSRSRQQLHEDARTFVTALARGVQDGSLQDLKSSEWSRMHEFLTELSRSRAEEGTSPTETATFLFSFKRPLFALLKKELAGEPEALAEELWHATALIDGLGLQTTEIYQRSREEIIRRQQQELMDLSTPVVKLWKDILALPLIGTLDSSRTQVVMQNLLEAIVAHSATIAIIDITGVPTVDTLVAQHLLKTVAAARLMGADCIISGIRPQIAQTIIHLGVDLADVTTKATLADAFQLALRRTGGPLPASTASSKQLA